MSLINVCRKCCNRKEWVVPNLKEGTQNPEVCIQDWLILSLTLKSVNLFPVKNFHRIFWTKFIVFIYCLRIQNKIVTMMFSSNYSGQEPKEGTRWKKNVDMIPWKCSHWDSPKKQKELHTLCKVNHAIKIKKWKFSWDFWNPSPLASWLFT